jgi:phage gp29-like protein
VRTLAWPYLFKNYSLRDLAEFLEIYGLPLRLGKYPSGATDAEKGRLMQAVVEIGHNAAGIIPESMSLEFKEAAKGQADPFLALITWAEKTMSKAVLGATLTSQADGASSTNALGNVHNEVRHDIRDADLRQIANTLTRDLLWPMIAFNVQGISSFYRCPKFVFNTAEAGDIKLYSEALPSLQNSGMRISKSWLHETTQIPEPIDENDVLTPIVAPVDTVNTEQTALTSEHAGCQCNGCTSVVALKSDSKKSEKSETVTPAEEVALLLSDTASPVMTKIINDIKELVEQAENFDELQQSLIDWADSDTQKLADAMGQAMVLAELQGRSDMLDDALNA